MDFKKQLIDCLNSIDTLVFDFFDQLNAENHPLVHDYTLLKNNSIKNFQTLEENKNKNIDYYMRLKLKIFLKYEEKNKQINDEKINTRLSYTTIKNENISLIRQQNAKFDNKIISEIKNLQASNKENILKTNTLIYGHLVAFNNHADTYKRRLNSIQENYQDAIKNLTNQYMLQLQGINAKNAKTKNIFIQKRLAIKTRYERLIKLESDRYNELYKKYQDELVEMHGNINDLSLSYNAQVMKINDNIHAKLETKFANIDFEIQKNNRIIDDIKDDFEKKRKDALIDYQKAMSDIDEQINILKKDTIIAIDTIKKNHYIESLKLKENTLLKSEISDLKEQITLLLKNKNLITLKEKQKVLFEKTKQYHLEMKKLSKTKNELNKKKENDIFKQENNLKIELENLKKHKANLFHDKNKLNDLLILDEKIALLEIKKQNDIWKCEKELEQKRLQDLREYRINGLKKTNERIEDKENFDLNVFNLKNELILRQSKKRIEMIEQDLNYELECLLANEEKKAKEIQVLTNEIDIFHMVEQNKNLLLKELNISLINLRISLAKQEYSYKEAIEFAKRDILIETNNLKITNLKLEQEHYKEINTILLQFEEKVDFFQKKKLSNSISLEQEKNRISTYDLRFSYEIEYLEYIHSYAISFIAEINDLYQKLLSFNDSLKNIYFKKDFYNKFKKVISKKIILLFNFITYEVRNFITDIFNERIEFETGLKYDTKFDEEKENQTETLKLFLEQKEENAEKIKALILTKNEFFEQLIQYESLIKEAKTRIDELKHETIYLKRKDNRVMLNEHFKNLNIIEKNYIQYKKQYATFKVQINKIDNHIIGLEENEKIIDRNIMLYLLKYDKNIEKINTKKRKEMFIYYKIIKKTNKFFNYFNKTININKNFSYNYDYIKKEYLIRHNRYFSYIYFIHKNYNLMQSNKRIKENINANLTNEVKNYSIESKYYLNLKKHLNELDITHRQQIILKNKAAMDIINALNLQILKTNHLIIEHNNKNVIHEIESLKNEFKNKIYYNIDNMNSFKNNTFQELKSNNHLYNNKCHVLNDKNIEDKKIIINESINDENRVIMENKKFEKELNIKLKLNKKMLKNNNTVFKHFDQNFEKLKVKTIKKESIHINHELKYLKKSRRQMKYSSKT